MKFEELRLKNKANLDALDKDIKDFQRNTKNIERRFYETQEQADERRKKLKEQNNVLLNLKKKKMNLINWHLNVLWKKKIVKNNKMDMDIAKLARGSSGFLGIGKKQVS